MNLVITQLCNRDCPYCFAQSRALAKRKDGAPTTSVMSKKDFRVCVQFAIRSGEGTMRLLGGEPTLHPEFMDFVEIAAAEGLNGFVYTNGLWPDALHDALRAHLAQARPQRVNFLFNINEPSRRPTAETARQARSLAIAGPWSFCGFNIYHEEFDLLFLAGLIDTYGMQRSIRVGLAAPIAGTENAHLGMESFPRIGRRLAQQARQLDKQNIVLSPDCGFPVCMFDEADLGAMSLLANGLVSKCAPVLDIGPDLTVWPCYPLGGLMNVKLGDFTDSRELDEYYRVKLGPLRRLGMREECLACRHLRRDRCCGGCIAYAIRQLAGTT